MKPRKGGSNGTAKTGVAAGGVSKRKPNKQQVSQHRHQTQRHAPEADLLAKGERRQQEQAATGSEQDVQEPATRSRAIPYTTEDHILLVGEGNFSFAAALATLLGCAEQVVATSYDSEEELQRKYPDASQHTSLITDLGGKVLHGVDACNLAAVKALKGKRFTKIIFNFPHVGAGIKDQDRNIASNQAMLTAFFASAKQILSSPSAGVVYTSQGPVTLPHGEVHVTLKKGLPYDEWGVPALASAMGFVTKSCSEFRPEWYEGYEHRRTIGYDATKAGNAELVEKTCRTWAFVLQAAVAPQRGRGKGRGGGAGRGGRGGRGSKQRGGGQGSKGKRKQPDSDSDSD